MFYKKYEKRNLLFSTSFVTALLISINLMTIYFLLEYLQVLPSVANKYYIVAFMILVWGINYYGIVKKGNFLTYNFKEDKKGGYAVVLIMIVTFLLAVSVGNLNREKIFEEKAKSNGPKKESLEGKIREWFNK